MVFTTPDMDLHQSRPTAATFTQASFEVVQQPGPLALTDFAARDQAAAQQQPPQEPQAAEVAAAVPQPPLLARLVSAAVLAGCVGGAAVEEALDAAPRVARMVLGCPEPAGGSIGVRLFRQATRAGYTAAGYMAGAVAAPSVIVAALL